MVGGVRLTEYFVLYKKNQSIFKITTPKIVFKKKFTKPSCNQVFITLLIVYISISKTVLMKKDEATNTENLRKTKLLLWKMLTV